MLAPNTTRILNAVVRILEDDDSVAYFIECNVFQNLMVLMHNYLKTLLIR